MFGSAGLWASGGDSQLAGRHHDQPREGWCQVQFLEGRLATVVRIVLVVGVFLAFWRWSSLGWHARGLILAAYGVVLLLVVLLSVLRLRARARGTVVGVERRGGRANDRPVTYFHPRVRVTTPAGRTVVFTSAIGSTGQPRVGASLPVRYRLADPEQAEVVSVATWVLGAVAILFGLGLLVAGVVLYLHE